MNKFPITAAAIVVLLGGFGWLASLQPDELTRYLLLAAALFAIGLYGVLTSSSAIKALMSLELLFNAANVNFIVFCYGTDYRFLEGQVFALFVMAIAAAEAALGLALVIEIFRRRGTVTLSELDRLQG